MTTLGRPRGGVKATTVATLTCTIASCRVRSDVANRPYVPKPALFTNRSTTMRCFSVNANRCTGASGRLRSAGRLRCARRGAPKASQQASLGADAAAQSGSDSCCLPPTAQPAPSRSRTGSGDERPFPAPMSHRCTLPEEPSGFRFTPGLDPAVSLHLPREAMPSIHNTPAHP